MERFNLVEQGRRAGRSVIQSRDDYRFYLEADKIALDRQENTPRIDDGVWRFERLLRKVEYYYNCRHAWGWAVYRRYLLLRFHALSVLLGYSIPLNAFGPGLSISHPGTIVVNAGSRIGENCRIHVCVNIGTEAGYRTKAPRIGNNVYIGPGAKIFGDLVIADDVAIGANAVVDESVLEPGSTVAGVPAHKVSAKGSKGLVIPATQILRQPGSARLA